MVSHLPANGQKINRVAAALTVKAKVYHDKAELFRVGVKKFARGV